MARPNDTGYIKPFGKSGPFPCKVPIPYWMRLEYSHDRAWVLLSLRSTHTQNCCCYNVILPALARTSPEPDNCSG